MSSLIQSASAHHSLQSACLPVRRSQTSARTSRHSTVLVRATATANGHALPRLLKAARQAAVLENIREAVRDVPLIHPINSPDMTSAIVVAPPKEEKRVERPPLPRVLPPPPAPTPAPEAVVVAPPPKEKVEEKKETAKPVKKDEDNENAGAFELVMKVRDYELDQYCVVNNAVYANYCQEARAEMFARCGINTQNIAKSGNAIATVEMNVKYLAPLRTGEKFVVSSKLAGFSSLKIITDQTIYRLPDRKPIVKVRTTMVHLDSNYRPTRLPEYFTTAMKRLLNNEIDFSEQD